MGDFQLAASLASRQFWQRLGEAFFQSAKAPQSVVVCLSRRNQRHVRRHDEPDLFAHMIERQHFVEEHQASVGKAEFILCLRRKLFDLADGVVGENAHCAGRERRQARQPGRPVSPQGLPQHRKHIAFDAGGSLPFRDVDLAPARDDALVG